MKNIPEDLTEIFNESRLRRSQTVIHWTISKTVGFPYWFEGVISLIGVAPRRISLSSLYAEAGDLSLIHISIQREAPELMGNILNFGKNKNIYQAYDLIKNYLRSMYRGD